MAASRRPGEITYYEELGVENTASAEEIRDAFRALARILHPDAQTDPQLKAMAERQMRKLNHIHAVLSDPTRRSAYDHSLNSSGNAPIIVFSGSDVNLKKLIVRVALAGCILAGMVLLVWFAVDGSGTPEVRGQEARGMTATRAGDSDDADAGDEIAQLRARVRTLETERNSALTQLSRLNGKAPAPAGEAGAARARTEPAGTATALDELAGTSAAAKPAAGAVSAASKQAETAAASLYTGSWVFQKTIGAASAGGRAQYPPEYIEMNVVEQSGALHGKYHSRYQVLDHAISPDVDFEFTAVPAGPMVSCAWQGPGGARGRMTMKILPAGDLEVTWNATELGSQQWLLNGNAMLTKK